jgi:hypothetical protein
MRLKSELYNKEQEEIIDKICNILDLENRNIYTLYELDNNVEIQKKIMELIPEIRKWFSFNGIKAVGEPEKIKRPWLSIIKKTFGNPEETIICIGDWEQRKQMKYKEPTLGKGMRTLFRKNNYKVYLVDEFRSSCKCSNCEGGICEKFRVRQHPNKKKDELRLVHGLLRCKSGCGLWNRDRNGSSNIYKIAENVIKKLERPSYLCRESNQALKPSCYKQTLQGYETTQH